MTREPELFYVCERCFSAAEQPGHCPRCQKDRLEFTIGTPEDPVRRPPLDAEGHVRCRAPLWWVTRHAPYVRQRRP